MKSRKIFLVSLLFIAYANSQESEVQKQDSIQNLKEILIKGQLKYKRERSAMVSKNVFKQY